MRLITFEEDGRAVIGVRHGADIVHLALAAPDLPRTIIELIDSGAEALAHAAHAAANASAEARRNPEAIRYLPVIPHPRKFVGFGLNYASHVIGDGGLPARPSYPGLYLRGAPSLTAHRGALIRPLLSTQLDYECELAFVIGKRAKAVRVEDALDHVFGYTCFNDGSLRDFNRNLTALAAGKNFDATGALGPELVTVDELPPGAIGLNIMTRRNGETVQSENTRHMWWSVAEIIVLLTEVMTLEPGDVVATGTCGGCIIGQANPDWLKAGETVEVEIEGIGIIRNTIFDEVAPRADYAPKNPFS